MAYDRRPTTYAYLRWQRTVYSGLLTTAAINGRESEVKWWDALDVIGSDGYYKPHADDEAQLVAAWQPFLDSLGELSAAYGGKKVG
jgi:hypothetical protein